MKKFYIFILFFCLSKLLFGQSLSDQARFGLLTVSPGGKDDAIYQIWGHSVLHLYDPVNQIDECYDYGTFSFNQPGFIIKFLRGTLPYQMAKYNFAPFADHYKYNENRSTSEQILNLSQKQKQDLYEFLINNYKPENREYRYRFFYYNCSSRLRDILQQVCGDSLRFSPSLNADLSYRQWINKYAESKKPWMNFWMNIAIGIPSDQKTKESGAMFLPDNLAMGFDSAQILVNGQPMPLVIDKRQHTVVDPPALNDSILTPALVFVLVLIFTAFFTYWQIKNKKINYWLDHFFFGLLGLAGFILGFLWFFTDHGVTSQNMNIVWAFPLLFPLIFFSKTNKWVQNMLLFYAVINILLMLSWKWLPQQLPMPVIPLIMAALIRIFYILKINNGLTFIKK